MGKRITRALLLLAAAVTLWAPSASAQRYEEVPTLSGGEEIEKSHKAPANNHFRVGFAPTQPWQLGATLAPLTWGNGLNLRHDTATQIEYQNGGTLFGELEYPLSERLSITATASATFCFANFYNRDSEHIGNTGMLNMSLTVGATYDYLAVGRWRLWGNAGLGLASIYPMEFYVPSVYIPLLGPVYPITPTFDLYPLCVSFGSERGIFLECGVGTRGFANGGCYFSF